MDFDSLQDDSVTQSRQPATQDAGQPAAVPPGTPFDSLQDDSQTYGSPVEQAKAGIEGLARGATLGLSDVAETGLGISTAQAIKARREENPWTSFAGEAVGAIAPIVATAGAAAPLELGAVAGGALTGGVLGAGNLVSDLALGDHNLNAQMILADVGGGIAGGAAFGLLEKGLGALPALFRGATKEAAPAVESAGIGAAETAVPPAQALAEEGVTSAQPQTELEQAARFASPGTEASQPTLRESVDFPDLDSESQQGLLEGLSKLKPDSQQIIDAAQAIGAPIPEGLLSDSSHIQRIEDMLRKSPTIAGIKRAQLYDAGYKIASGAVSDSIGVGADLSSAEAGNQLKNIVYNAFEQKAGPIKELYSAIEDYLPAIPVTDRSTGAISKNILGIIEDQGLIKGTPEHGFVSTFADGLDQVDNLQKLKQFRTALGRATGPETRYVSGIIKDKLDNLEQNAIKRYADTMKTPVAKEKITGLLDQIDQAKSGYAALRQEMGDFGKNVLGRNKIYGPQDFLDAVESQTPERFAKRIFTKDNSEFLGWLNQNIPQATQLLSQYQRAGIRDSATNHGGFSPQKAISLMDKLSPEVKSVLFKPEELQKIEQARTYLDAFPQNFNPSGTSSAEAYRRFFEHPITAMIQNASDAAATGLVKTAVNTEEMNNMAKMGMIYRIVRRTNDSIASGAKSLYGSQLPRALAITGADRLSRSEYDETAERLRAMSATPTAMADHLAKTTVALSNAAPNITQGLQTTIARGVQFLTSKLPPGQDPAQPLAPTQGPSNADKVAFGRYLQSVDNPLSVFKQVRAGQLTPETMEALQAVHPDLLNEMRKQVMANFSADKARNLTFSQKSALSQFLGQPLDANMTPQAAFQNQQVYAQPNLSQQATPKPGKSTLGGLKELNFSGRSTTRGQSGESPE